MPIGPFGGLVVALHQNSEEIHHGIDTEHQDHASQIPDTHQHPDQHDHQR